MKFNKYYLMSAVFCMALASCSDDVVDDQNGNPDNTEQAEGVKDTYATFSFNFSKGVMPRAARATADGTEAEKAVNNFTLLIFKNVEGHDELSTLEEVKEVTGDGAQTFAITSGPKKIYILANAGGIKGTLLTQVNAGLGTPLTLNSTLLKDFENLAMDVYTGNPLNTSTDVLGTVTGADTGNLLMTGVSEVTLAAGVTEDDAKGVGNSNNITIGIDRAAAKITIGQAADAAFTIEDALFQSADFPYLHNATKTVGTIASGDINYAIFNQNSTEFITPKSASENNASPIIQDPNYAFDSGTTDFSMYYNSKSAVFDVDGTSTVDMPATPKAVSTGAASAALYTNASFVAENTNEWPVKGNTTYAMLEAIFQPEVSRTVSDIVSATTSGTLQFSPAQAALTRGASFIYCDKYGVFLSAADLTRADGGSINQILSNEAALKSIKILAAKMISDANQAAQQAAGGAVNSAYSAKTIALSAISSEAGYSADTWYIEVTASDEKNGTNVVATADNAKYYTLTVKGIGNGTDGYVADGDGVATAKIPAAITFAIYPSGKCYYRVNIENPDYASTIVPLHYAVIRNYWYQIDLTKFTSVGYPNPAIAAGVGTDALEADTHVNTTIAVRAWTVITMDPEVGL